MLTIRQKLIDCCETLRDKARPANLSEQLMGKIGPLIDEMENRDLVVPVVGAFSSGKSSLVNSILGSDALPVAVTPETSLATEMRYSTEETIEAIRGNGTVDRYGAEEMKTVSEKAADYSYARFYLNNDRLKEIEPFVLVDMPGFDSPLDVHNKAILAYLDRGCHYIVLSSVEEGTLTKSLGRRLREIDGLGRGFSFFLTKANLKTKDAVDELARHFLNELQDAFDYGGSVIPLDNKSAEEVVSMLKGIDADKIFFGLYRERVKDLCYDFIDALNIKISAAKKDSEALRSAVRELRDGIEKLRRKAETETDNMRRTYSGGMIEDIVNTVGRALENAVEELVGAAMSGNEDEIARRLNEIVRSELLVSVKNKLGDVNQRIVMDFSQSIQGLDKIMKDLDINDHYIQDLSGRIQTAFTELKTIIDIKNAPKIPQNLNIGYKIMAGLGESAYGAAATGAVASLIGTASSIVMPVVGIALLFLPEIVGAFSKNAQNRQKEEMLRNKLLGEVFPGIKRKIRAEIPQYLAEQVGAMIEQVRVKYEEEINTKSAEIDAAIAEKSTGAADAEANCALYEEIRAGIQVIAGKIIEGEI